jgi:hypothetical protein
VFSGPSENGFVWIHLLENRYKSGLTTLKTRDSFVRRKIVAVLVSEEAVRQVEATFSEVQGNLCGMEAVSYTCRKCLCGKFYADGFT